MNSSLFQILLILISSLSTSAMTPATMHTASYSSPGAKMCRDRYSAVDVVSFRRRSCARCFFYLFSSARYIFMLVPPRFETLRPTNISGMSTDDLEVIVEVGDDEQSTLNVATIKTFDALCAELPVEYDRTGCRNRLAECCRRSGDCCRRQLDQHNQNWITAELPTDHVSAAGDAELSRLSVPLTCPSTWDGFSCWDETPAGTQTSQPCPVYMERAIEKREKFSSICLSL